MRTIMIMGTVMLLGGCDVADAPKAEDATPAKLQAGLYEATSNVTTISRVDKDSPLTTLKPGSLITAKGCVSTDGTADMALFGEAGDVCTPQSSYIRNGRMSVQLACTRPAHGGNVLVTMDGKFTADGFSGVAQSTTHYNSYGNFSLSRKLTARRVGACPATKA